jgi:hypothetical protein
VPQPTDPFTALFSYVGDFFNGNSDGAEGSVTPSEEWDPWDPWDRDRGLQIKSPNAAPDPAPGSIRQYLRQHTGPRLIAPDAPIDMDVSRSELRDTATRTGTKAPAHKPVTWTATDATWKGLGSYEKAAAMALLEADKANPEEARNVLASMINRAKKRKYDLGESVSSRAYQPSFEPKQQARLSGILKDPNFTPLVQWAASYESGNEDDPTGGATHFLAEPSVMLSLEAQNPAKYSSSWRNWTRYDPASRQYGALTFKDSSHHFLAPEGKFSVKRQYK